MDGWLQRIVALGLTVLMMSACGGGGGGGNGSAAPNPNPNPNPPPAQALFRDVTAQSGISYEFAFNTVLNDMSVITYGGAAVGDINGNGYLDIFITRGDQGPNLLYRNLGNLTFEEVAFAAGVAFTKSTTENYRHSGPIFADMNGNGHLDLFLGGIFGDPSMVFRNNGDGTFTDVTTGSGLDTITSQENVSASFGDYDLDGRPDLFITHWGTTFPNYGQVTDSEHLWRNVSDGDTIRFESVSFQAGLVPEIYYRPGTDDPLASEPETGDWTFTATFARLTDSLYPDLLVAADFNRSQVFRNNGDDTFTNVTNFSVITDDNGMGSAVADFHNRGQLDWFVTSIRADQNSLPLYRAVRAAIGNRIYRNVNESEEIGSDVFADITSQMGVSDGGWGWGACAADFENNGRLDIFHVNGWPYESPAGHFQEDRSRLFVQRAPTASQPNPRFDERAVEFGIVDTTDARTVVCADFNNNGLTDILVLHNTPGQAATLWENTGRNNNYLRVKLNGLPPNTEASNARIRAQIGGVRQMREILIGANYASQVPTVQIFGLGTAATVDELTIEWPEPGVPLTVLQNVPANETLEIDHPLLPQPLP
jgi:enediyne biosynthesis protein E4